MTWQDKVRRLMEGHRWRRAVAKACGVGESTITRWLSNGSRPLDEPAALDLIARELARLTRRKITPEWLVSQDETLPEIGRATPPPVPAASPPPTTLSASLAPPHLRALAAALEDPKFVSLCCALLEVYKSARVP